MIGNSSPVWPLNIMRILHQSKRQLWWLRFHYSSSETTKGISRSCSFGIILCFPAQSSMLKYVGYNCKSGLPHSYLQCCATLIPSQSMPSLHAYFHPPWTRGAAWRRSSRSRACPVAWQACAPAACSPGPAGSHNSHPFSWQGTFSSVLQTGRPSQACAPAPGSPGHSFTFLIISDHFSDHFSYHLWSTLADCSEVLDHPISKWFCR